MNTANGDAAIQERLAQLRAKQVNRARAARSKGERFERAVVKDYERMGWQAYRLRQGGGEIVDIIALVGGIRIGGTQIGDVQIGRTVGDTTSYFTSVPIVHYIQVRYDGHLSALEKEQLFERAFRVGAHARLAWREGRTIQYKEVRS